MNYEWGRERVRWHIAVDIASLAIVIPLGIAVGGCALASEGVRRLARKLRTLEDESLAEWNMVLGGFTPNTTIDKLIEEEDGCEQAN